MRKRVSNRQFVTVDTRTPILPASRTGANGLSSWGIGGEMAERRSRVWHVSSATWKVFETHFKTFYDLLAYEAVNAYCYRGLFQEAEGQPIRTSSFRSPIRKPESKNLLPADKLYADLDRVMVSFFRDLNGDDDPELRRNCFVTSNESTQAETSLARISEELRNKIRTLRTNAKGEASEITKAIQRVQEMRRHEFILLVGTKGAGKSTFIERFFEDILPRNIADDCVLVRIDLSESGADERSVIRWLDEHFLDAVEKAVFVDRQPDYDDLRGMYFREYDRLKTGAMKHLYDSDELAFKIEFGKHLERRREERPHEYIVHMLHRIVHSDGKVPCLIFDNADHFTIDFQEHVFQYAHSLFEEVLCLVIVPITDKTSWQLSRQGALQSFFTESFFLPTPPPEIVLRKRVEYIEKKIQEDQRPERGRGYFFGRGIELSIENLRIFTSSIQTVFINTGEVANWIGNLANQDIRRCLQLTRDIISSPHIKIHEMWKAIIAKSSVEVDPTNVKLAMIRGKYDIYAEGQNAFVQNLYALTTEIDTSPLIGLRILQLLEDTHFQQAEGTARYVEISHIKDYCSSMDLEPRVTTAWLDSMLKCVSVAARKGAIFAGQGEPAIGPRNQDRSPECGRQRAGKGPERPCAGASGAGVTQRSSWFPWAPQSKQRKSPLVRSTEKQRGIGKLWGMKWACAAKLVATAGGGMIANQVEHALHRNLAAQSSVIDQHRF